ncbi:hypothetical protein RUND412_002240 [Rhizina undulata]
MATETTTATTITAGDVPSNPTAPTTSPPQVAGQKRTAAQASNPSSASFRSVKRRASKACQCCRARKVRCNVVEHGAPCTNCRLDEVECIITESKRRKKFWGSKIDSSNAGGENTDSNKVPTAVSSSTFPEARPRLPSFSSNEKILAASPSAMSMDGNCEDKDSGSHVPHLIYQAQTMRAGAYSERDRRASFASSHGSSSVPSLTNSAQSSTASSFPHRVPSSNPPNFRLPGFIKPTPARISPEDLEYLWKKGALSLPNEPLRSELLKSHFDFAHPYMPLLDKKQFMEIVRTEDGSKGKISLLLFQAVMFIGSAFVDMESLRAAGFTSRKAARKAFFTKTRLLYDFDHEQDRISLIQALLLMTYWYETPDDQKDTWHWMGVAISLSHTIGLHRNPENSNMDIKRQKLWKRIWWSCYMRDRLVALGMRRPTRIKEEDCDVPMLTIEDFEIDIRIDETGAAFRSYEETMRAEREVIRQRKLAVMCIEKAKLCVCISQVLTAQYSVLNTNQGSLMADGNTKTTMMLLPKKLDPECCEVARCDEELTKWVTELPPDAIYQPLMGQMEVDEVMALHRNLLHMVYFTTVSALHRPQVLPSAPAPWPPTKKAGVELQEVSRKKVRQAASEITRLAEELIEFDLVKYLPTTGVTVMLPAVIIHLLDIKSSNAITRELSLEGFGLCMQVMQGLRQSYSAADYATHFLEAAIKKADIHVQGHKKHGNRRRARYRSALGGQDFNPQPAPNTATQPMMALNIGSSVPNAIAIPASAPPSNAALTPPPDLEAITTDMTSKPGQVDESDLQLKLESFLQGPPSPAHQDATDMLLDMTGNISSSYLSTMNSNHRNHSQNQTAHHLSIPGSSDAESLDSILGPSNCDPFLGHYEDGAPLSMGEKPGTYGFNKPFDLAGSSWLESGVEDMSKILDSVDFDIDDVIQVLETEIN